MKRGRLSRRFQEDVWGDILLKGKDNKITGFFKGLLQEKLDKRVKKSSDDFVYRVDLSKPKRKGLSLSRYGRLLSSIRKLCLFYGDINFRDLKSVLVAGAGEKVDATDVVFGNLESRLEVILYRLHFVNTVKQGRELIKRGGVMVDKRVVKSQGCLVKPGSIISIVPGYQTEVYGFLKNKIESGWVYTDVPAYLEVNYSILSGCLLRKPVYSQVPVPFTFDPKSLRAILFGII